MVLSERVPSDGRPSEARNGVTLRRRLGRGALD